ncbi:hypothetical protein [Haliscomenobacter hydrossis]|uniref:Uncharacterized protein n=1 Tax=Haliscomenobacter hydrossis (strain ATCC 27775 / DSM 1100 / LMG 10767 / O) TaxID=760192 RepID=F4L615_HALH1|nr:hypothetical protein [Haliscomenobacter hydrossis]AEE53075.1 hypothetical protein Halhy_5249 [Haliscomenobacter hydrossis DSM 1100]
MSESITIYYLGSKSSILNQLTFYLRHFNIELEEYEETKINQIEYLMLLEPVLIRNQYYVLSSLWKNWLMDNQPNAKLIIASYRQSDHPNALNLLDFPGDIPTWLKHLPKAGAYQPQYAGYKEIDGHKYDQYSDPWKFFPLPLGLDIKDDLSVFLNGHDRVNSFVDQLIRLRKAMMDLQVIFQNEEETVDKREEIAVEHDNINFSWKALKVRWDNYQDLFKWLPFKSTVEQLMQELKDLAEHIDELSKNADLLPETKCIDKINHLLAQKIQRYVYYEAYW